MKEAMVNERMAEILDRGAAAAAGLSMTQTKNFEDHCPVRGPRW